MTTEEQTQYKALVENVEIHMRAIAEATAVNTERLDRMDVRFEHLENRSDQLELRVAVLDTKVGALDTNVESLTKPDVNGA